MKNTYDAQRGKKYTKVVAAYMRYSSLNQDENSIKYQRTAIKKYARSRGYLVKYEYVDEAKSGTTDKRKGFQQMMADARSNPEWSVLLVYDLSRFARNLRDACNYVAELDDLDIEFVSVTQDIINNRTGEGILMMGVINGLNQYFSQNLAKHVHAGQKLKANDANHCGGKPPLGYDVVNKKLVVNEAEAYIVRLIFNMYENNFSYKRMADELNAKGYTNKFGRKFVVNSFYSILRQEKYTGMYIWNKVRKKDSKGRRNQHAEKPLEEQVRIPDAFPAIIDREQFDRVQKLLSERNNGTSPSKNRHFYLLSGCGFLKCAECGSLMIGSIVRSHGKTYKYYYCPKHKEHECSNRGVRTDHLDPFVIRTIVSDIYNRDDLITLYNSDNNAEQIRNLKDRIRGLEKSTTNLVKAICEVNSSEASKDMRAELEEISGRKHILKSELARLEAENGPITEDDRKKLCRDIRRLMEDGDSLAVKMYLKSIIREITVSNTDVSIVLNIA